MALAVPFCVRGNVHPEASHIYCWFFVSSNVFQSAVVYNEPVSPIGLYEQLLSHKTVRVNGRTSFFIIHSSLAFRVQVVSCNRISSCSWTSSSDVPSRVMGDRQVVFVYNANYRVRYSVGTCLDNGTVSSLFFSAPYSTCSPWYKLPQK